MTEHDRRLDRPLEESPEVTAAVEDESTVPQLADAGDRDPDSPTFRAAEEPTGDFPATGDVIGAAMGGGTGGAGAARTGADQPWEAEDLAVARGQDPTPENVRRARDDLAEEGPSAVERTVP